MAEINYEQLREDMIRYLRDVGQSEMDEYGTAMQFFPVAMVDLGEAESRMNSNISIVRGASDRQLEAIANELGFDLDDYKTKGFGF